MYLGIDLGTTNSVVSRSFVDARDNLVTEIVNIGQLFADNWDKYPSIPSMVYFSPEGRIVGREAKAQRDQDRDHVVTNSKRFMGTNRKWFINNEPFEAKDIAAIILQHCKRDIDRAGNMKYDSVVITVPASFNPDQISDTIQAAKIAGFDNVIIKHEPTAALLSFIDEEALKQKQDRIVDFSTTKRILVFDLGGGTCDTSVIDVQVEDNDKITFTERGVGRYQELGGIDFDAKLAEGLLNSFFEKNKIMSGDLTDDQKDAMYRKLLLGAEVIKEKISAAISNADPSVDVETIEVVFVIPDFYKNKPLRLKLTKKDYDEYTKDLYIDKNIHFKKFEDLEKNKNIITVIRKTLEDYDIKPSSIDYVFMTGGMSKFLTVRQKVGEYLKKTIIMPQNPMDAVARGASIYQHYKVKQPSPTPTKVTDGISSAASGGVESTAGITDHMMLAEAILLDVNEGLPRVIIPRKTFVPYSGEILGEFRTSSPSGVKLNIYAAEDEFDSSMRLQKSLEKMFRFPFRSGTPFDIKYKINENKEIEMKIFIDDGIHSDEMDLSVYSDFRILEKDMGVVTEDKVAKEDEQWLEV